MLPVPLAHLPSWSHPLILLISQTDSSLPAVLPLLSNSEALWSTFSCSRTGLHPFCMSINFPSQNKASPQEKRENIFSIWSVKSYSDRFSTWLNVTLWGATCALLSHIQHLSLSWLLHPRSLELELLISSMSEIHTAVSSLFNLLLRATLWASDSKWSSTSSFINLSQHQ